MSTGRSRSLSGALTAFSFPLGAVVADAALDGESSTVVGAGDFVVRGADCWKGPMAKALSREGESERAKSSSSESKGEAVLGVLGMEMGEEAMLVSKSCGQDC